MRVTSQCQIEKGISGESWQLQVPRSHYLLMYPSIITYIFSKSARAPTLFCQQLGEVSEQRRLLQNQYHPDWDAFGIAISPLKQGLLYFH